MRGSTATCGLFCRIGREPTYHAHAGQPLHRSESRKATLLSRPAIFARATRRWTCRRRRPCHTSNAGSARSAARSREAERLPHPLPEVGGAAQAEPLGRFAPMVALFRCFGMVARQPLNRDRTPAARATSSAGSPATGPDTKGACGRAGSPARAPAHPQRARYRRGSAGRWHLLDPAPASRYAPHIRRRTGSGRSSSRLGGGEPRPRNGQNAAERTARQHAKRRCIIIRDIVRATVV